MENPLFFEFFKEFRDNLVDIQIDEVFSMNVLHCLRSTKISPEGKTGFSELFVERFENEIKLLNDQIKSYHFQDPKKFLENLPLPK